MKKILHTKPNIGKLEKEFVYDAIDNGWGDNCYDYIYKFQDSYKSYLDVNYAIATSSCTGAIHIALKAMGIKPGDEVIVPDATWVASVAPITYLSAKPIFVDVLDTSWCIDPKEIEKSITPKTKAIIAVHLYGNMCEMDEIMRIAKKNNLYVIEDCAEAIGSEYKGKKAGSIGDFGTFSFHGTKTITSGEGGMLVTNDKNLFEIASILHDHGRDPKLKKDLWVERIGFKYKMSNLQAALGYAQMQRIDELVNKKIEIFNLYKNELSKIDGIRLNSQVEYVKNTYWMPTIILDEKLGIDRNKMIDYLNLNGTPTRPFFYPASSCPEFEKLSNNTLSIQLGKNGINLPSYFDMTNEDIQKVSSDIIKYLNNER
tara:strand:- start:2273 stop:3385 length:1113 start_codon:yes stop_codon:yes gene_type:complete